VTEESSERDINVIEMLSDMESEKRKMYCLPSLHLPHLYDRAHRSANDEQTG